MALTRTKLITTIVSAGLLAATITFPLQANAEYNKSHTAKLNGTNIKVTQEQFREINDQVEDWQIRCRKRSDQPRSYWRCGASNGTAIRNYRTKNHNPIAAFINNKDILQLKGLNQNLYVVQIAAFLDERNAKRYIKKSGINGLAIRKALHQDKVWYNITSRTPQGYKASKQTAHSVDLKTGKTSWIRKVSDFRLR